MVISKQTLQDISREGREKTLGYIVTAFGLVAGLAWNEAIKSFIEFVFPPNKGANLAIKFFYAVVITIVVVIASFGLNRLFTRRIKEEIREAEKK